MPNHSSYAVYGAMEILLEILWLGASFCSASILWEQTLVAIWRAAAAIQTPQVFR